MNAKDYQRQAVRTLISKPDHELSDSDIMLVWTAIGLAGEAGEVVEHVKKGIFHQHGIERSVLKKELGDVMWYIASICEVAGLDLGEIIQENIDKLLLRYPNGYSSQDSQKRVDVKEDK